MSVWLKSCLISIMLIPALAAAGCTSSAPTEGSAESYAVYEAVFLNNDEVAELFASVRGEPPFDNVTKDYHVTTEFMPTEQHPEWYGEQVSVHITAYAVQDIKADDGQTTANEGFKAELGSENPELAAYLSSLNNNYHITGAYRDAAKYTGYIDFSAGEPMDTYLTGTFGGYYSDGAIDVG